LVASPTGSYRTELSQKLAKKARKDPFSRPAVGDWVVLSHPPNHEFGKVEAFLPRKSSLKRRDPLERSGKGYAAAQQQQGQVVVSNVDIIFVVQALTNEWDSINLARLERELVLAYQSGANPVLVLTKADKTADPERALTHVAPAAANTPIIIESAVTGRGVEDIRRLIKPGTTAVLLGASGVGKSTLTNRLLGRERQETKTVRERDDKGRHTTVARELVEVPIDNCGDEPCGGGMIIDTPGMRGVGLWEGDLGLPKVFPEIDHASEACRFGDCAHSNEPHCGVKAAVEAGEIDPERLARYHRLVEEIENL
jgi:ribosome biogenesis GTPase